MVETFEKTANFDFKLDKDELKTQPQKLRRDDENISVACFVLLVDSPEMQVKDGSFSLEVLGVPMFEYVARACPTPPACLRYNGTSNILSLIRPYLKDAEYSLVLFSDTPLMTRANVMNILDFAKTKGLNVLKLTRGYVFKNEYIKRVEDIYAPTTYYFEEEDFMVATTYKQLYVVSQTLKNRIITYHMNNGVYFADPDSTYIEANVSIGSGTKIGPFVSLMKDTKIGDNVIVGARSTLLNAKIMSGAQLDAAYVDGGVIMQDAKVKSGAKIYSQTAINQGAVVGEETTIENAVIGEHSMVGKNCIIEYTNCENKVSIGNNCLISGTNEAATIIREGATIEDGVNLYSASVQQNTRVNRV